MAIALVVLLALAVLAMLVLTSKPAPRACLGIAVASPTEVTALIALVTQLVLDLGREGLCDASKRPLIEAEIASRACSMRAAHAAHHAHPIGYT